MSSTTANEAAAGKSTFSYAQAAKGSSTPSTPSIPAAQDSATQSSAVSEMGSITEELSHPTTSKGSKTSDAGLSSVSSSTKDEKAGPSSVTSDLIASSVLPNKEDDDVSDVTSPSESAVEQDSRPNVNETETHDGDEKKESGRRGKGKRKGEAKEKAEKPAPVLLKEAPIPTVNFWQQRASVVKPSSPVGEKSSTSATTTSNQGSASNTASASASTVTQPVRSTSFPKRDEANAPAMPLLPRNDEVSWPTPLTAQDEERRRAQELQEKADKEKSSPAMAKPHGKNEWKPVAYTPTVKFNTPLPALRGRGGKVGVRGGRVPGPTERSLPVGQAASNNEVPSGYKPRSKSEGGFARSAAPMPTSKRAFATQNAEAEATPQSSSEHHNATAVNGSADGSATVDTTASTPGAADLPPANAEAENAEATESQPSTMSNGFRDSQEQQRTPPQATEGAPVSRRQRRGSHLPTEGANGDKKRASESGFASDKGSWIDNRENRKDSFVSREERPSRGRGKGGRGGLAQTAHFGLGQHGYSVPQNASHHTKTPSYSYYTPAGTYTQGSRGGYRGGRASVPTDAAFGRYAYPAGQFMEYPYATNVYNAYPGMMPMANFPYVPQIGQQALVSELSMQLNYYFSIDNLVKDVFLRRHMDSQGFVPLSFIASFKRMKDLTTDLELIKFVCLQAHELELRLAADGKDRIRRKDGWEKWVMPMEDRDPSARHEGPPEIEHSQASYSGVYAQPFRQPQTPQFDMSPHTNAGNFEHYPQSAQGFSPVPVSPPKMNGIAGPSSPSASHHRTSSRDDQTAAAQVHAPITNGTSSPKRSEHNDQDEIDTNDLLVAVKPINSALESKKTSIDELPETNGAVVGERLSRSPAPKRSRTHAAGGYWIKEGIKEKYLPLPSDADFIPYDTLRNNAIHQRRHAVDGQINYDLRILFTFWSCFLVRNFNLRMYIEFAHLAFAEGFASFGMDCLLEYYGKALASDYPMHERVAMGYLELVISEDCDGARPAFYQLKSAWRNGATNMKNRKKISDFMDADLKAELDK